jgi:hypothetical protein
MIPFLRRRKTPADEAEPERTDPLVSQPGPLERAVPRNPTEGFTVSELSELEARALCAREDIPVFWPRPNQTRRG